MASVSDVSTQSEFHFEQPRADRTYNSLKGRIQELVDRDQRKLQRDQQQQQFQKQLGGKGGSGGSGDAPQNALAAKDRNFEGSCQVSSQ